MRNVSAAPRFQLKPLHPLFQRLKLSTQAYDLLP